MKKRKTKSLKQELIMAIIFAAIGISVLVAVISQISKPSYQTTQASGYKSLSPGTDNTSLKRDIISIEKSLDSYRELVK